MYVWVVYCLVLSIWFRKQNISNIFKTSEVVWVFLLTLAIIIDFIIFQYFSSVCSCLRWTCLSRPVRHSSVRAPRTLWSILPMHQRHSHLRNLRKWFTLRRQRRCPQSLQLQLGRRVWQSCPWSTTNQRSRLRIRFRYLPRFAWMFHELLKMRIRGTNSLPMRQRIGLWW